MLSNSPAVYGWDQKYGNLISDGVYAITIDHNAINSVYRKSLAVQSPNPEGLGYYRQFYDKTFNSPAVYGWDQKYSNLISDGVYAISISQSAVNGVECIS